MTRTWPSVPFTSTKLSLRFAKARTPPPFESLDKPRAEPSAAAVSLTTGPLCGSVRRSSTVSGYWRPSTTVGGSIVMLARTRPCSSTICNPRARRTPSDSLAAAVPMCAANARPRLSSVAATISSFPDSIIGPPRSGRSRAHEPGVASIDFSNASGAIARPKW
jgi:hypothetical protein